MSDEYKAQVLATYREKQASGTISLNLSRPTPARLKAECLAVFSKRFLKKDEMALRAFFEEQDDATAYMSAIKKCDIDKFRPLRKFMDGDLTLTDDKNIALLAWLIDFEPRPYRYGQSYGKRTVEPVQKSGAAGSPEVVTIPGEPGIVDADSSMATTVEGGKPGSENILPPENKTKKLPAKPDFGRGILNRAIPLILVALMTGGTYLVLNVNKGSGGSAAAKGIDQCMYWTGDSYSSIPCNQKMDDKPVIALDATKVAHFRRITRTDTLTANSLRKVWYFKLNNQVEFYTAPGFDPVHTDRKLKPLTAYILHKYAH
jgi:hypothetical protein